MTRGGEHWARKKKGRCLDGIRRGLHSAPGKTDDPGVDDGVDLIKKKRWIRPQIPMRPGGEDGRELLEMAEEGKINEAENKLYELMDGKDMTKLHLALLFYEHLLDLPEEFLTEHGFSREEILDGVKNAADIYGVGGLAETLIS